MTHFLKTAILFVPLLVSSVSHAQSNIIEILPISSLHSWAGYHVGVDVGVQTDTRNQSLQVNDPQQSLSGQGSHTNQAILLTTSVNSAKNSPIGGMHADYLFQHDSLVYGFAADLMTSSCKTGLVSSSSLTDPSQTSPDYVSTIQGKTCLNYFSSVKGEIGKAIGNALFYIDGGVAIARVKSKVNATISNIGNPPPDVWTGSTSKTMVGYVIGAGIRYALDKNISIGLNLDHYDLGKLSYTAQPDVFTAGDQAGVYQSMNARIRGNLLKLSVDYQF